MGQLICRREGSVEQWRLSNPGKANAIDLAMLQQLDAAVARVQADASVRVVLLSGTPGGTFSSGADIAQWGPMSPEAFGRDWIAHGNAVLRRFEQLRCPSVAAIEGLCFGGGLELALCADLRLGTTAARLRFPEAGIGAIAGWEGGPRLARLAGHGRALQAVLTTREIDAATALDWGVLNALAPAEDFAALLDDWLAQLAAVSPQAAALGKQAIACDSAASQAFHAEAGRRVKASPDAQEGLRAFFDKRPARF